MGIQLNGGNSSSFIAVPADVIDKHLATVSGIYIKVLLAVIRLNAMDLTKISKFLSIPESDVTEAVGYWTAYGILGENTAFQESPKADPVPEKTARRRTQPIAMTPEDISAAAVAEQSEHDPQIKFLLCTAECLYGRPLTSAEQKGLVYIHEYMGLPADVIIMAVEYCISIDKPHFNYIQKMCAQWVDDEINTHPRAEAAIKQLTARRNREGQVRAAFGIQERALTAANKKYINQWFDDGFDIEMIQIAYERTVDRIGKISFPYINKILQSWKENGIFTPADLETKEKPRPYQKGKKPDASYDLDEFERLGFHVPK